MGARLPPGASEVPPIRVDVYQEEANEQHVAFLTAIQPGVKHLSTVGPVFGAQFGRDAESQIAVSRSPRCASPA
jgi:hypothetical protein